MKTICFVCLGNICRSPMAEILFNDYCHKHDLPYHADSLATSHYEVGNPVYPPIKETLLAHDVDVPLRRATQLCARDYDRYDYFVGMDDGNMHDLNELFPLDKGRKIRRFASHSVADPWYTREFEKCYQEINDVIPHWVSVAGEEYES